VEEDFLTMPLIAGSDQPCADPAALASEPHDLTHGGESVTCPSRRVTPIASACDSTSSLVQQILEGKHPGFIITLRAVLLAIRRIRSGDYAWAFVLCDQMVVSGTSFLTTVLIGRTLGKHQLGLYVLAYSVVVVLLEVQNSFIASPYTMKSPQLDLPAQARYTGSALVLTIGLSATGAVVLFAVGMIFPAGSGLGEVKPLFLIVSLIVAPLLLREFGRRVCFAHFHVREVLSLDSLGSLIQIGGLLLLFYFGFRSVRSVYWLIASASGITAIVWLSSWRHRTVITFDGAILALRDTWSFGMWVLTGNLAILLSQQVYPWYLAWLKGPDATGTFAACTYLLALMNPFLTGVGNYLGPATANASIRGDRELSRVVMRASLLLFLVVGMCCLAIVMFGNHLLRLLYGVGYRIDIHVLAVLGASVVILNSTLAVGFGFWAIGRPDVNLKINSLAVVIAVTAGPLLVGLYGLVGAAYGLLLAAFSVSVLRVLMLRRVLHCI
jgi:O-antigen/teichoic acid export membrane protein